MSDVSPAEIKRYALDASDWLWGTVQGAWNEKQTVSQIIVDAVIGMIPVVGDVTAVRDLIAVSTRMGADPKKREDVSEWILLVVLIFALIPVVGGVIKGVGRLLLKLGKNAAEDAAVLKEIIQFLNRIGHGDAVKFIRQLDLLRYQNDLIRHFHALMDTLIESLSKVKSRLAWMIPASMERTIDSWVVSFKALKPLGNKMIPKAVTELNQRLKRVQQALYQGEWHTVHPGVRNVTREEEARLIEQPLRARPKAGKWPQNSYADYQHKEGWPDLRRSKQTGKGNVDSYPSIAAFSGKMEAVTLRGPKTIYRVLRPKGLEDGTNAKASPWWTDGLPPEGKAWRENYAVLDEFNKNSYYIVYQIPAGQELKVWRGRAAEQFDPKTGQYLGGGGEQLYIQLTPEVRATIEELPVRPTGWGETSGRFGYASNAGEVPQARTELLSKHELESKRSATNSKTLAATRVWAAENRNEEKTP